MAGFLVVAHDGGPSSRDASDAVRAVAISHGLKTTDLGASSWLVSLGPRDVDTVQVGAWTLIGRIHDRRAPPVGRVSDKYPHAYEKKLLARFWGGFIGLSFTTAGQPTAVLRDPSGALDCAVWREEGLTLIGSGFPDWLLALRKPSWRIAYDRVHAAIIDPALALGDLLMTGPVSVAPGTLQPLPEGPPVVLWRPDWITRSGQADPVDDSRAAQSLREAVDEAVAGLARPSPVAAEVSGGLDSAIVAASLVKTRAMVPLWLSAYGPDASGDERPFVERLARRLDLAVSPQPRRVGVVTRSFLETMPQGLRPGLAALDGLHDADWSDRLRHAGLTAILTGKGGDGLFVQPATGAVFSDLWRERGWRALASPALPALARWTNRSVWSLVKEARRGPTGRDRPKRSGLVTPLPLTEAPPMPAWLTGINDFGPAKRAQISAVLYGIGLHGPSLQTEAADVLHPLLTQPVVEACLRLPVIQLTLGRRDRALARRAFAERLPPEIIERRSKGEMSAFYGRMIAGGLDALRPWLLDGRLAAEGVIDRAAAESLLTPESLIWRGGYADIMNAAAFEGWVRAWEARLGPTT
ncbi:asparagine synthase-related protein [Brevundimonas mediterranea]|uniref:Asparagine synthetase domain-containing protein n=1 Tax=Brevundimonas mediterranea TaxID=74329 RepID=A0A7Z9C6P4_9CAUL|nr:asparagine synthase-related protein [Brevundimonas mediterranea]VDC50074.1 hypothetical protein BREV_BREV_00150 [Brevundimonas mediterranea]